jgi:hypothetical protein
MIALLLAVAPRAEAARRGESSGGPSIGHQPAASRPGPASPGAGASGATRPGATRPAATHARGGRAAVEGRARAAAGRGVASIDARYASARQLCVRGGKPVRGGHCRGAGAAASDGGRGALRWQAGLPPADRAQRECPDGTLATLARGHDDIVRCIPL